MSIFGLVLDDTDLRMPLPVFPTARKKSNLVKRLRQKYSEVYHHLVVTAKEDVEYERRLRAGPNLVSLPVTVTKATELPGVASPRASSPPRQIRRISRTSTPVKKPTQAAEAPDEAPRVSIESPEIEMYMSPPRIRPQPAPLESEAPLVIQGSPVPVAMDDSALTPKRSRSPVPVGIPEMPVEEPVQMEEQVEAPPQPTLQPVQQVPGRRILKANRMRRNDELPSLEEGMDDNMMQMGTPLPAPPRHSLSSYGTTPQSFTNPSPSSFQSVPRSSFQSEGQSGFQSGPRSSFGSVSGTSSFQNTPSNPFLPSVPSGSHQSFSNQFQTPSGFGSAQSQSSFRSNPPVFQAQPPQQQQSHEPEQPAFQPNQQAFNPSGNFSFSFGQPSTPAPRRSRQGRRKPGRN